MIFDAFFKAIGQAGDPRFRRVLFLGVALTIGLLAGFTAGFAWLAGWIAGPEATLPLIGQVTWLGSLLSAGSVLLMLGLSMFLMVPVASAFTSMFLDQVAQAVEDKHYPHLPKVPGTPFGDALKDTVNFLGVLIAANLLALILYLIFLPAGPLIFWALNGFLLGREYFTLAAIRRVGEAEARKLRRRHMGTIWLAGTLMAMPLSVPLVNLLVPIFGAATFTHIFHALAKR